MDHITIIEKLGGPTEVARLMGIRPPSVHQWKADGIPDAKLIRLAPICEARGIATRRELFPKDFQLIWPELAGDQPADAA